MQEKQCTRCGEVKPTDDFHRDSKLGFKSACKVCRLSSDKRYNQVDENEDGVVPTIPPGFHVKGVSTYHDDKGAVKAQWVKAYQSPKDRYDLLLNAVKSLAEPFQATSPDIKAPKNTAEDLLCVIPLGDPHFGMFSWGEETGADNFDLKLAESQLYDALDQLVSLAPNAKTGLLINVGDFFHADSLANATTKGTNVDVDTRMTKVLQVGVRFMRRAIERMLEKFETVHVKSVPGNHDQFIAVILRVGLSLFFENNPRVIIDQSPNPYQWFRFGKNLIGVTHGDMVKLDALAEIMACDRPTDWGDTDFRFWYTGHVHHDTVKELRGCIVETFRTMAPRDYWHHKSGYRSGQDLKLDIIHKEYGRECRHTVGVRRINGGKRDEGKKRS